MFFCRFVLWGGSKKKVVDWIMGIEFVIWIIEFDSCFDKVKVEKM